MDSRISEADWKKWRKLSPVALNRLCAAILQGTASFIQSNASPHSRYLDMWKYLHQSDNRIADVFNDQRRSNAFLQIAVALKDEIITRDEFEIFSDDTKDKVEILLGGKPRRLTSG